MKLKLIHILFLLIYLGTGNLDAQLNPGNVCHIVNGRVYYNIDLRWNEKQKEEIATRFSLDSAVMANVYKGVTEFTVNNENWKVKRIDQNIVELSKNLNRLPVVQIQKNDIFLIDNHNLLPSEKKNLNAAVYGLNSFSKPDIVGYNNDIATFYLPGYRNARNVYLAGSFNDWNTLQSPMQHNDSGWVIKVKLPPGKYFYKYIVDGRWMTDPNNNLIENDGMGNDNSVLFCYNYTFRLNGYTQASSVNVTGSFNNWNKSELPMKRTAKGWELPLYLKEGSYSYKFVVANAWINDPSNKRLIPDSAGNENSLVEIGDAYIFKLKGFTNAKRVVLAGSFNDWKTNELHMEKTPDGWQLPVILSAGMYEYKFIVDGRWMPDPNNPFTNGSGDLTNSVLAFKPNYTFVLPGQPNARSVLVSGNFNNWSTDGYRMTKVNGVWKFPIFLKPGKYLYKFVVNGNWITDPNNKLWEQNEYGTGNSVLWIGPQ